MPEGPECRIFTDNLNKTFGDQSIRLIEIIGGRYLKQPIAKFDELKFPINKIKFNCKGKFIYWITGNSDVNLCFTLGMTGAFAPRSKHSVLKVCFDNGEVFFNDPRRFGTFRILNRRELNEKLNSLGWDILVDEIPHNIVDRIKQLKYQNKTIAELLMDQTAQCGIGNYIKSEACYVAKILPSRLVQSLTDEEIINLYRAAQEIARSSYIEGGATISTFEDMYGNIGKFFDQFKVYRKKIDPLGNPVTRVMTKDGRSTFYVSNVQK